MNDPRNMNLAYRISNCLRTILELEPELERLEMGDLLLKEFGVLKSFLRRIEAFDLQESDVERIEQATITFLEELRTPLCPASDEVETERLLH